MGIRVTGEKVMIFRNEYNGKTFYNAGISKKLQDGTYENGNMPIVFKKDVEIPNSTKINILDGFITFYKKEKATIQQIFVMQYEFLDGDTKVHQEQPFLPVDDDSDLPF